MNYLHSGYQKAGKISNDDLLYTLSVFITEPISWIGDWEWRTLNEMEICAIATFWKGIGDAMGISYHDLRCFNEWRDGIEFFEDIKKWAEGYEREFMVPNEYNKKTADELVPLLLFLVPKALLPFARDAVGVLMGPLLRSAMIYPKTSRLNELLTISILRTRQLFLRYLSLPRPEWMRVRQVSDSDDKGVDGRYHSNDYLVHPYYQLPGFWNRWGPIALVTRAMGGFVPDEKRGDWFTEGYRFEEVGPDRKRGEDVDEMRGTEEKLEKERTPGCPFAFGK